MTSALATPRSDTLFTTVKVMNAPITPPNNDILFSSNEEREKVYRMIEKMCLNREIIPPPFDKNRLDKIKYKFPLKSV